MDFGGNLIIFMTFLGAMGSAQAEQDATREYCSFEHFNATCDPNHVIVMTSARYGRMRLGKCVTNNLGYIGHCVADAMNVFDGRCTGRRTCYVSILDQALRDKRPCANDVTWHLEASYKCVPVIAPAASNAQCSFLDKPIVLNTTHLFSSVVAMDTRFGSTQCPWKLRVADGQRISLSVYDTLSQNIASGACYTFANVIDDQTSTKKLTICPDDLKLSRLVQVFVSKSKNVELSFWPGMTNVPYLIQAEVEGCPNITTPKHGTIKRKDQKLTITCDHSGDTWTLVCKQNHWQGTMGNCSAMAAKGPWAMQHIFQDGILIAVALGVALGIFLGGLLLVIVGSRMKRRQRQRLQQTQLVDPPEYDVRVEAPQRFPVKTPGVGSPNIEYTLSRGTDYTSDHERQYSYRKPQGGCPREIDTTKMCTSPYHAYETPTLT